jgi:hypothetical protein
MTELHPSVRAALDALAPTFGDVPSDWDDALHRGARSVPRRRRRSVIAVAIAAAALLSLAASPFGQAVVRDTLDRLGAWVDGEPGDPASPAERETFRAANAASFASFPDDTKLRRLIDVAAPSSNLELLGFRDGEWLCLRLTGERQLPASCVKTDTLAAIEAPIAIVSGQERHPEGTALYGFAVDGVRAVDVVTEDGVRRPAQIGSNAFLHVSDPDERIVSVIAIRGDGGESTVPVIAFHPRFEDRLQRAAIPGPAEIERDVAPSGIGWLERREERGRPFQWPLKEGSVDVAFARSVEPDPTGAFRMGVGVGEGTVAASEGRWFCLQWQWPLVEENGYACIRAEFSRSHLIRISEYAGGDQLPIETGLVSDQVASMALFYADGTRQPVPLEDNVFAVQVRRKDLPGKLVTYDDGGRVIGIDGIYGHLTAAEDARVDR